MRRLDFVERHLDRMARSGPWQAQMTVVDADIMPVEPHLAMIEHAKGLVLWQWVIIVLCALIAGFMLGAVIF